MYPAKANNVTSPASARGSENSIARRRHQIKSHLLFPQTRNSQPQPQRKPAIARRPPSPDQMENMSDSPAAMDSSSALPNGHGSGNGATPQQQQQSTTPASTPKPDSQHPTAGSGSANASTPGASTGQNGKTRRTHRKSRNGCVECKRRHIRCDERRPVCSNCATADRSCVFPRSAGAASSSAAKAIKTEPGINNHPPQQQHPSPAPSVAATPPMSDPECAMNHAASSPHQFPRHPVLPPISQAQPPTLNHQTHSHHAPSHPQHHAHHPHSQSYPYPHQRNDNSISPSSTTHTASAATNTNTNTNTPPTSSAIADYESQTSSASIFSPQHLQLLHHAQTVMVDDLTVGQPGVFKQFVNIGIRHAIDSPYLINQILALAANHLATRQLPAGPNLITTASSVPNQLPIPILRHLATELQTRAVASFTRLTANIEPDDTATCIPRFVFSSALSMQALSDSLAVLREADSDFHSFIESFVDCFHLHRGIIAVIRPTWQFLSDSELRPLLEVTREASMGIMEHGTECKPLQALLARSDLGQTSLDACHAAAEKLQWAFDLHNNLSPGTGHHAVSAFTSTVPAEFVDVVRKHRPEALVILSYYAVLLHRCRKYWIFQDAGAYMIRAIAQHIGSYWRESMAWPLHVVQTEHY